MDMGALVLVPAIAGCVVVGFPLALFAANAYLTILQQSGAGAKLVEWPKESIPDHFWKVFYLAWIIGLWLGPAIFIGRWAGRMSGSEFVAFALPIAVFWLVFPVSQMSSLSGPTIWLPLWPDVPVRMVHKRAATLGFYAWSGVLLIVFGAAFHWTFLGSNLVLLLIGAPLLVVCWAMYARLLGRLAFVLMFARPWSERKRAKPRKPRTGRYPGEDKAEEVLPPISTPTRFQQPSQQTPLQSPSDGPTGSHRAT
jgi:hypothetical protein